MDKLNKNNIGLSLGIIFLIVHVVWFVILASGLGQQFISWMIEGHFIKSNVEVIEFKLFTALLTLLRAFIFGYVIGWLFSFIYNKFEVRK